MKTLTRISILMICFSFFPFVSFSSNDTDMETILSSVRNTIPNMKIQYDEISYYHESHPINSGNKALYADQEFLALHKLSKENVDTLLNTRDENGNLSQFCQATSLYQDGAVYITRKCNPGSIYILGQDQILSLDIDSFIDGFIVDQEKNIRHWSIEDKKRFEGDSDPLKFTAYPIYYFGYMAGQLLKEGAHVSSVHENPDAYTVTLASIEDKVIGRFQIVPVYGYLATKGLIYTSDSAYLIQIECNDIVELEQGFFYPLSAKIILRHNNPEKTLPDDYINEDLPTNSDSIRQITITNAEILGETIKENTTIIFQKDDEIFDYRSSTIADALNGIFDNRLRFIDEKGLHTPRVNSSKPYVFGFATEPFSLD